nr:histone deacetylase 6 [Onthophagus taurus]
MKISPGFYGQLITLLGGLAQGRQVVCLEGGYFLESLAEGAAMSVKSLLDDAPGMVKPFGKPEEHIIDVINNLRFILQPFWKCFESFPQRNECVNDPHRVMVKYLGVRLTAPFLTHDCYPVQCEFINEQFAEVVDEYRKEYSEPTGNGICYAFDEVMFEHKTPENFPERPERLIKLYEKFTELKLHERLIKVSTRKATEDELLLIHDKEYIDSLINSKLYTATRDVYFTPESLPPILTSAGCLLNVVDQVMTNKSRAGVAMIRPPGHHAEKHQPMGFCFINNIALAAKYILTKYKTKRILILDFDVHHGNGTQKAFYNSKEVLYISVHQYNNGNFFPNGSDGNFNMHGEGRGVGYNVNIPFNKENPSDFMTDTEYITIFNHIILPISYSFGPEVILVSAGFDAGLDDPIGHYRVTPEAFGHFIQLLKPLARGKMILSLEGGYNVNTVAYSMTMCIKALLGDPLPSLEIGKIRKSALETLEKVINVQKRFWPILQVRKELPEGVESLTLLGPEGLIVIDSPDIEMLQKIGVNDDNKKKKMEGARKKESIGQMKARMRLAKKLEVVTVEDPFEKCDKISGLVRKRTGLTYDDNMALHECPWDEHYPENPLRYIRIFDRFVELDLINRCQQIPSEMITNDLVEVVHSKNTYEKLNKIMGLVEEDMQKEASKYDAIYFNDNTFEAACIAAGSVMNAVKSVCTGETQNAFALVRPPGHHAMFDEYCGYCYFNNVAIGAKVALKNGWAEKILIVDFDVHHGQATQQMFYDDDSVLYFSLHRYEHGTFWPNLRESNFDFIGGGKGKGYNVNVPLNCTGLEDKDYFAVIFNILLPIAYEFNPDLVIFSAGFDSAIGDEKVGLT